MTGPPIDDETLEQYSDPEFEQYVGEKPRTRGALRRDWKLLPRALPYLRPYLKFAIPSIVITVLIAIIVLAEPWPLAFVIDSVLGEEPPPGWVTSIVGDGVGGLIALAVIATLVLTLLSGGLTVLNEYLTTTVDQKMSLDFRSDLFQHVQRLSLAYHDSTRTGVLMYRLNSQAGAVGDLVTGLPTIAQSALTIVGMAVITFTIDPVLALLAMVVTPFLFYSTTYYADRIEPRLYRVRGLEAMNMAIVHEAMAMIRVVLAFGREKPEYRRFRKQGEKAVRARVDLTVRQTAFQLGVQLITAAGTAAVLGVGAYQAVEGRISAGELIVILTYVAQVYQPLEQLTSMLTAYQQHFISFRHSLDLLDEAPQVTDKPDARAIGRARGEIELDGVGFSYKEREDVLRDVSFTVPAGGAVALVGATGAGKSTLASLLPRFYDPEQGRVLIDGTDVRDLTVKSLRAQFSIVLQEPLLFSGTIFQNIRYGKRDATQEEVEAAAKAANAHDFITELPEGYQTKLGERGTKISGGERQRIAVARAFLRDAPILILDEPTSSIDSKTESVILDAIERLMEGRTTIVIAHRLSTVGGVDEILVLDEGRLVERGSHEELVANGVLYRQLWETQTRGGGRESARSATAAPASVSNDAPIDLARSYEIRGDGSERVDGEHNGGSAAHELLPPTAPQAAGGSRPKVVLLGMLTKIPFGGVGWLVGQYATGFERLGYEVYYVEAHARTPSTIMTGEHDDATRRAVRYIAETAKRFGLEDRWAFHTLHETERCYGMSAEQLDRLYRDAALIIDMHGGTLPLDEHAVTDRLVFLGTDPVEVELGVNRGDRRAVEFLEQHAAFFTWGLNFGNPDCRLPWAHPFPFVPSPPPVVLDFWDNDVVPNGAPFTTIGNWRQPYRDVRHGGRVYSWSKHEQFLRFLDLPLRAPAPIELALSSYEDDDHLLLAEHGWRVRPGLEFSRDLDSYRDYIVRSTGELSVAKEQNVAFRSGWFSERSATYLASGRPVVMQDTGFGAALPTGEGLLAFSELGEAAEAVAAVQADPARHRRAARELAREFLSHEVVLGDLLDHLGLPVPERAGAPGSSPAPAQLPAELSLEVISRRPLELVKETIEYAVGRPVPAVRRAGEAPGASVVVPVADNVACTRLSLESVLANTDGPAYEIVVVDNSSAAPTRDYVEVLAARNRHVRLIRNDFNLGFAGACNQGLAAARGDVLVLLNNDTIVPPGWLSGLAAHLEDPALGLVGATTNRCGGPAQIPCSYRTYGEMLDFASARRERLAGTQPVDIEVAEMFCLALRRSVFEAIGPLDNRFEVGMFEDDDYARRVHGAGHRVVCAEDVFVHHFGEATLGKLAANGGYGELFHANRRRYEDKWGVTWEPHGRRHDADYAALTGRVGEAVSRHVPEGSTVLVASRGDDELVDLAERQAWHFPQQPDGTYTGRHPADDEEAIAELERLRALGADYLVLPATALWWLNCYPDFRRHLDRYPRPSEDSATAFIYRLTAPVDSALELRSRA